MHNYATAFLYTGILQGLAIVVASQFMQNPDADFLLHYKVARQARHPAPNRAVQFLRNAAALRNSIVLYLMMLMMGIGGLMVTAQVAPVASSLKISAAALTVALTMNPIANGIGRVFWGWVSDHAGREWTMIVAFTIQALSLLSVLSTGTPFVDLVHRVPFAGVFHLGRDLCAISASRGGFFWRAILEFQLQFSLQLQGSSVHCRAAAWRHCCLKRRAPGARRFMGALRWRCVHRFSDLCSGRCPCRKNDTPQLRK